MDLLRSRTIREAEPLTREAEAVPSDTNDSLEEMGHRPAVGHHGRWGEGTSSAGSPRLRQLSSLPASTPPSSQFSPGVVRYVELFNRRDWEGLRNLLADDVNLQQAGRPVRTGAVDVGMFFTFYAKYEPVRLVSAILVGRHVIAVFGLGSDPTPSYVMWLQWLEGKISFIHDYRYARHVILDADLVFASSSQPSF